MKEVGFSEKKLIETIQELRRKKQPRERPKRRSKHTNH